MNCGKIGKMKYIEELIAGDTFEIENKFFLLTSDFKKNGSRLAFSLQDGSAKWFNSQAIVESLPVYRLDNDNNTVPLKIEHNVPTQTTNLS